MAYYVIINPVSVPRVFKTLPVSGTSTSPVPTTGQLWPRGDKS